MSSNKGLLDFIIRASKSKELVQRGLIHGTTSKINTQTLPAA